ncbi:hypothetical protein [Sphingomonas cannabina]|uniref:hypothetical protein n=1 Tax=Sphingomonas cannabina TaxID=2899123 RepID=UPI0029E7D024|nr:hypothetical protein [Sphingomonas cannabina]
MAEVLARVRRYMKQTGMPATEFGRRAANDPRLVSDLLNGREPGARMIARIEAFIAAHPERRP